MAVSCSQHVLDNEPLGLYAVKKVAVGDSHDYLAKILKEVKLLQRLRHENIVSPLLEVLEAW
jgi:serine/threonine protein kinase